MSPGGLSDALSSRSCLSQSSLAPSTTSTSLLDSAVHLAHASAPSEKHDRRSSLGLIDAARVRFTKDFQSLVRSNSKPQRVRTVLSVQTRAPEDPEIHLRGYDKGPNTQPANLATQVMELLPEERQGRSLGTRIVNFLSRSRSRSRAKKRRSRSLDAAVSHMPMPLGGAPLSTNARHQSFDGLERPAASSSTAQPATRSVSRPLSSTDTTAKPRPKKVAELQASAPASPRPLPISKETVIQPITLSSKMKKMNIFGLSISAPRKASLGDGVKSKSRPPTPRSAPADSLPSSVGSDRPLLGARSASGSTSQRSHEESRKRPALDIEKLSQDRCPDTHKPSRPYVAAPVARPSPIRLLSTNRGEYSDRKHDAELETIDLDRSCSPLPLCGWATPKLGSPLSDKGKETMWASRERAREREREGFRRMEKEKQREREHITHPRRVGSPALRERERESRSNVGAAPMEKVASGSENSRQSRRDALPGANTNAAALAARAKRTKHGSFDFERPVSVNAVVTSDMKAALDKMGIGKTDGPHTIQRSHSTRVDSRRELSANDGTGPKSRQAALASLRDKGNAKPKLDVNTSSYFLTRRVTGSSTATSNAPRSQQMPHSRGNSQQNDTDRVPTSPNSSHSSGHNSSWGRSAGKRVGWTAHGPFKFEPAVPPIPGSPADERKRSAANGASGAVSPLAQMRRSGRSLDLGIGLSWAPSRVREDAVLPYGIGTATVGGGVGAAVRARARWRGATVDEEGRLSADSSIAAADVAASFREALGDAAYATFKTYVHRFDAQAIPLDGPFGLLLHVERLLDSAPGLDERGKRLLLDKFLHIVRENH